MAGPMKHLMEGKSPSEARMDAVVEGKKTVTTPSAGIESCAPSREVSRDDIFAAPRRTLISPNWLLGFRGFDVSAARPKSTSSAAKRHRETSKSAALGADNNPQLDAHIHPRQKRKKISPSVARLEATPIPTTSKAAQVGCLFGQATQPRLASAWSTSVETPLVSIKARANSVLAQPKSGSSAPKGLGPNALFQTESPSGASIIHTCGPAVAVASQAKAAASTTQGVGKHSEIETQSTQGSSRNRIRPINRNHSTNRNHSRNRNRPINRNRFIPVSAPQAKVITSEIRGVGSRLASKTPPSESRQLSTLTPYVARNSPQSDNPVPRRRSMNKPDEDGKKRTRKAPWDQAVNEESEEEVEEDEGKEEVKKDKEKEDEDEDEAEEDEAEEDELEEESDDVSQGSEKKSGLQSLFAAALESRNKYYRRKFERDERRWEIEEKRMEVESRRSDLELKRLEIQVETEERILESKLRVHNMHMFLEKRRLELEIEAFRQEFNLVELPSYLSLANF
ncbi:hypothetical protein MJO28_008611 [Puccinia striiformis f. sp. tritici]|uniref:Uncharacterized protein n=1 Tax=Puccinia striiformis f. sp. tritici TaxID=168172 RepID=A0ACC0ED13_9BASI|nr:hypothetical protein MJO28_008611 [Puccinia striiformis f. sp. tritici]